MDPEQHDHWYQWSLRIMAAYHRKAMFQGERAAQQWLAEQTYQPQQP
jgi:hypothetical protein